MAIFGLYMRFLFTNGLIRLDSLSWLDMARINRFFAGIVQSLALLECRALLRPQKM
jgi:hypothetical protein